MKQYKLIIFDLDGTLTDSGPGIINSVHYALEKMGISEDDRLKLHAFVGPPLIDSFQEFYGMTDKEAVKKETRLPVIPKLSPNVSDIVSIAKAARDGGADALSMINTLMGMAVDIDKRKPVLGNVFGGLSGPAIKPVALRMIYQVYKEVDLPILGGGGISNTRDALEFIMVGASAVSIGTGNFVNPSLAQEIAQGLENYLMEQGLSNIQELVGVAVS